MQANSCSDDLSFGSVPKDLALTNARVNGTLLTHKLTACDDTTDITTANTLIVDQLYTTSLVVGNTDTPSGGSGGSGLPGPPGPPGPNATQFPTSSVYVRSVGSVSGAEFLFEGSSPLIPNGTTAGSVFIRSFPIVGHIGVKAAWISFPTFSRPSANPYGVIHTFSPFYSAQVNENTQAGSMLYVTEDYNQTTRYSGHVWERNPLNPSTVLGFSTISPVRQTYASLGGFVFGLNIYDVAPNYTSAVFRGTSTEDNRRFYIRSVYLDNTTLPGQNTRVVVEFVTTGTFTGDFDISNSSDIIVVYPIE